MRGACGLAAFVVGGGSRGFLLIGWGLQGHSNSVTSIVFSHDDQLVLTASDDSTLKVSVCMCVHVCASVCMRVHACACACLNRR